MPISKRLVSTEEVEEGPKIVFFVMIGLLIGAVLREVNKRTKIPYTPMLLLVGIIIGELVDELGILGESAEKVQNMSPHMILLVFIPVLIFESCTPSDIQPLTASGTSSANPSPTSCCWPAPGSSSEPASTPSVSRSFSDTPMNK